MRRCLQRSHLCPGCRQLIDNLYKVVDVKQRQKIIDKATKLWIAYIPESKSYGMRTSAFLASVFPTTTSTTRWI